MTMRIKPRTWLMWAVIVLLSVLPLWLIGAPPGTSGSTALFGGSDDRAQQAIGTIAPGYRPWFSPVFTPASDEIASLLFALQAAIGAGVIGYWLGLSVARERVTRERAQAPAASAASAASPREHRAD